MWTLNPFSAQMCRNDACIDSSKIEYRLTARSFLIHAWAQASIRLTFSEEHTLSVGPKEHSNAIRIRVAENVSSSVTTARAVEARAAHVGTDQMLESPSIVWHHAYFQQSSSGRSLKGLQLRKCSDHGRDPSVGLIHKRGIPTHAPNVVGTGVGEEPSVQAASATQYTSSLIGNAILRHESLGSGCRSVDRQIDEKLSLVLNQRIPVWRPWHTIIMCMHIPTNECQELSEERNFNS